MRELTKRQCDTVAFIRKYIIDKTYPPTVREIANYLTISPKGAHDHLRALQKKGILRVDPHRSRSIELLDDLHHDRMVAIPLWQLINNEQQLLEKNEESWFVPMGFIQSGYEHFALQMPDTSMQGGGICLGDTLVFRRIEKTQQNSIVLIYLHDKFTIRRYAQEGSRFCLRTEPVNSLFISTVYTQSMQVIAQLVGVLRSYG
ncbi:transcriptional repressor LexA [Entomospira nematocerorum]|uniref:Repressor LexA n=1 Tax=Entomospira nematocerorum TaxID=2719987 RepID=A0A968KT12_9SPIO|nr:transcriptional repressor LexA [Entomospira nematocera]NIZ46966.1 repressor LexA [Entomospira nematocera]WDI34488.1 transcriptional repressor LexA [Entomospira nematocera]